MKNFFLNQHIGIRQYMFAVNLTETGNVQGAYNYAAFDSKLGSFVGAHDRRTGIIYPQGTCPGTGDPGQITCVTCKKK